jgi:LPXTG-motif cell wall-anchored protein
MPQTQNFSGSSGNMTYYIIGGIIALAAIFVFIIKRKK